MEETFLFGRERERGGGLVIGETRRESVAAASILWVVVCVLCRKKEKIVNRTAFFVFRFFSA